MATGGRVHRIQRISTWFCSWVADDGSIFDMDIVRGTISALHMSGNATSRKRRFIMSKT